MITIVDYGMGNLGSIHNMFKKIGAETEITSDLDKISKAKKILLPGVGAFDAAMKIIAGSELIHVLNDKALKEKIPVLGICLGMQLLTNHSDEGELKGLGWIDAETLKFKPENYTEKIRVPHMGWNLVKIEKETLLTKNFFPENRFYFVHSYYVKCKHEKNKLMTTHHGLDFDSAIINDNIFGAQFHPEKSHKFGMQLFKNFSSL